MKLKINFVGGRDPIEIDDWNGLVPPPNHGDFIKFDGEDFEVMTRTFEIGYETVAQTLAPSKVSGYVISMEIWLQKPRHPLTSGG